MPKVLRDIELSKNIIRCKNCKELKMNRYLDDILCDKCACKNYGTVNMNTEKKMI
jgi:hypothetical protein